MTLTYFKDYQELFQGCTAYWDGSVNTTLQDVIGGYHGTINGATKNVPDRFGIANKGLYFHSSEADYVLLPNVALTQCPTTVIYWARHPTVTPENPGTLDVWNVFCFVYGSSDLQSGFRYGDGSTYNRVAMRKYNGTTPILLEPSVPIYPDFYYYIACRYNANHTMDMFINNEKFSSSDTTVANTALTQSNRIGGQTWPPYKTTDFYLNELVLFKGSALSDEKIRGIYKLTKSKYLYPVQSGVRNVE